MTLNIDNFKFDDAPNVRKQTYKWDSATDEQKNMYKSTLNQYLNEIALCSDDLNCQDYFCNIHENSILLYFNKIIDSIDISTQISIPKCNAQTRGRPGWNDYVKPFKDDSMYFSGVWRDAGCPIQGDINYARKEARRKYHSAVKYVKNNEDYIIKCNVAKKLANKDSKHFWKEVNKLKIKNTSTCSTVDGTQGKTNICNLFRDKYRELYNEYDCNTNSLFDKIGGLVENKCQRGGCSFDHFISTNDVKRGISQLKKNKNDPIYNIASESLIHGTDLLYNCLARVFHMMITHGITSEQLNKSILVPIPKDKRKSINNSDNYRAIALSSILCKILEYVILDRMKAISTSDLQFGFKKNCSTASCSFLVSESI